MHLTDLYRGLEIYDVGYCMPSPNDEPGAMNTVVDD